MRRKSLMVLLAVTAVVVMLGAPSGHAVAPNGGQGSQGNNQDCAAAANADDGNCGNGGGPNGSNTNNGCGTPSAAAGAGTGRIEAGGVCERDGDTLDTTDTTPPTIVSVNFSGTPGLEGWFTSGGDVTVACLDEVDGSFLSFLGTADPASLPAVDGEHLVTVTCTDAAGNSTPGQRTITIDGTKPTITIVSPSGAYVLGQPVNASYSCSDATSGVASCVGDAVDGAAIDTSAVNPSGSFGVTATDIAGNSDSDSSAYSVKYGICGGGSAHTVMSPFKAGAIAIKKGRDVPVKIQVCDWTGAPVTAGVTATLSGPTTVSQNTHPSPLLRVSDDKLIFNLSTDGLAIAPAAYDFTIDLNDGSTIPFQVTVTK